MILSMRTILLFIFLLCILTTNVLAETLYVGSEKQYTLLPHASLYTDISQQMDIEEVQKVAWKHVNSEELAFPISDTAHWLKFEVQNNASDVKSYYLEYDVSTINFLDVYILQEGTVLKQYLTGSHRALENRALFYYSYLFPITLKAGEKKEIYVRIKHLYSAIPANMILKEQTALLLDDYTKNVLEGIFFGVMLVMFLYNFILYLMTHYKPYIAYILYLGTFGIWLSFRMGYGMFLVDIIGLEVYRYLEISISMLFTVFIIWFITGVLELQKIMPKAYMLLNVISSVFVICWVTMVACIYLETYAFIVYPSNLFFLNFLIMNLAIIIIVSILSYQSNRTAQFILLAWLLFLSSMIILTLSLIDIIPPYNWIMPYMQTTIVVETVMLSFILGDRYARQEKLLIQQSRLAAMGSMMENIAHQWRQPLSEINADLLALEMHIEDEDKKHIKQRMKIIEDKTAMMSKTIDDFQNFYNKEKSKEQFELGELLEHTIYLCGERLEKHAIDCNVTTKGPLSIYGVENEYLQVLIAIISNAIEALSEKSEEKKINIVLTRESKNTVVRISNNGKQIAKENLMKLFEPYFSTKESTSSQGIGLFMSRKIIEESFSGVLEIYNINDGVELSIKVKSV